MNYTKTCTLLCMLMFSTTSFARSADPDAIENVFTPDEVARALGDHAPEARASGALEPIADPGRADDEDAEVKPTAGEGGYRALIQLARGGGAGAPVWGPFVAAFRSCAPGCVPANYNIYRRGRHTCHALGRAIDVGAIICGGTTHTALAGGRFAQLVSCLGQSPGLYVLYREGRGRGKTRDHYDHAHVSIGCTL